MNFYIFIILFHLIIIFILLFSFKNKEQEYIIFTKK